MLFLVAPCGDDRTVSHNSELLLDCLNSTAHWHAVFMLPYWDVQDGFINCPAGKCAASMVRI
jgi:hypothetical protein